MSYGVNKPQGLVPSCYLDGSTWNGALNEFPIASGYAPVDESAGIFCGDPVKMLNNGTIGKAVAEDAIMGVFDGVQYTDANGNQIYSKYWPAGTVTLNTANAIAKIIIAEDILFDIQSAGTINVNDIGQNANLSFATPGDPYSGQSGVALAAPTVQAGTAQVKIIRLTPDPRNSIGPNTANPGNVGYNNVLVKINNYQLGNVTSTVAP